MLIDGEFAVAAPPPQLLARLFDTRLMASCLPGCETLEPLADDRYRAVVVVAMAGIKARFDLQVEVTRRDEAQIWAITRGEEGGRASTLQADSQIRLEAAGDGTLVRYRSEVALTGRLGRFALGMMKKKAQSLGDEFAANLQRRLSEGTGEPGPAPTSEAAAPNESARPPLASGPIPAPAAMSAQPAMPVPAALPAQTATPVPTTAAPAPTQGPTPMSAAAPSSAAATIARPRSWWRRLLDWLRGDDAGRAARSSRGGG